MCAEVGEKFTVRQVSEPQRGILHLVVLSWDASYGGVYMLPPGRQGQLLQDWSYGGVCADTAYFGPYLCRRVITVRVNVHRGRHTWDKEQDLHYQRP